VLPPLVLATDDGYARPLSVTLRSIASACSANRASLKIIVLHEALGTAAADLIRSHARDLGLSLELRDVRLNGAGFPIWGRVTVATYLRLLIAAALPDFDKALYLDGDTLVLGDLTPLLQTDTEGLPLAAVQDVMNPVLRCDFALPGWQLLGLEGEREYFNAGVALFDLRVCREREILDRAFWFLRNKPEHVKLWDQDALNWAIDGRWMRLPYCWNTLPMSAMLAMFGTPPFVHEMRPLDLLLAEEGSAKILHYAGPRKPWDKDYPPGRPRSLYLKVLARADARSPLITPRA
jgi:lipopolysaccharide biosynthesis glycosyltransferase